MDKFEFDSARTEVRSPCLFLDACSRASCCGLSLLLAGCCKADCTGTVHSTRIGVRFRLENTVSVPSNSRRTEYLVPSFVSFRLCVAIGSCYPDCNVLSVRCLFCTWFWSFLWNRCFGVYSYVAFFLKMPVSGWSRDQCEGLGSVGQHEATFDDRSVGAIVQRPLMAPFPGYWLVGRGPSENKERVVAHSTWILAGDGPPLRRHAGVVIC